MIRNDVLSDRKVLQRFIDIKVTFSLTFLTDSVTLKSGVEGSGGGELWG